MITIKRKVNLNLKNSVYLLNAILLCIAITGAVLMTLYASKAESIFRNVIGRNIVVSQSADALATSLVSQKGFISYYLLDGDSAWIDELKNYRNRFEKNLVIVKSLVQDSWEKNAVAQIEAEYDYCVMAKDRVLLLYDLGEKIKGEALHRDAKEHFSKIFDLCEQFKVFHKNKISQAIDESRKASNKLKLTALIGVISIVFLCIFINYIFKRYILDPIRNLTVEAHGEKSPVTGELTALQASVHGLIENAEQTNIELKRNQETLMQSEKMALVGKLAAGTAHSIRNPLTSVKMRLFSLNRSCRFTSDQRDDLTVISEEIQQINKIVENFLEFARPPKLDTKLKTPSLAVDKALMLLKQRLKSYNVKTHIKRGNHLRERLIDPEQLKEAIVNIIINACEAMENGGDITICEEELCLPPFNMVDVITITDTGPGIPEKIKDQVFNPFFTTKDDGTGLGLSIAFNIISHHGGWLDIKTTEGSGTSFVLNLPVEDM